jgi:hypothetical protein
MLKTHGWLLLEHMTDAYISGSFHYSIFLGVFIESPTEFTIDAKSVTSSGTGQVECLLTSPNGRTARCPIKNMKDGTYVAQYAPYEAGSFMV